ncbi:porin family protein [Pseudochryseolinea flava]|uniref:Outer membrane protein beta-barrel domain-containing protein n=1 Tax=Pseudochryseolinea flava TaxID=2059302 RepID=A0A364XY90_9BACT|nr:porin family protein [Pseudochryseolinea flava]RAV99265.1 hypothetical protein DQQ10_20440 [Pseudochryseolinea flava]
MKKILLVSAMVLVAGFSYAQSIIPKAGVTMSMFTGDISDSFFKPGFTFGAAFNMPLGEGKFSLQPEINFIQKGVKMEGYNSQLMIDYTQKLTINYLEVPVLIKVNFGKFHLNVGPSAAFGLGGKSKYKADGGDEVESDVKFGEQKLDGNYYIKESTDVNLQFGFGFTVAEKVLLDFRSGFGLTNFDQREDYTTKNLTLQFTVGVPLSIGK